MEASGEVSKQTLGQASRENNLRSSKSEVVSEYEEGEREWKSIETNKGYLLLKYAVVVVSCSFWQKLNNGVNE